MEPYEEYYILEITSETSYNHNYKLLGDLHWLKT
jgi:hypothetical protein